jgi:hypothetical protein
MTDFTKSPVPKQDDRPFYKKKRVIIPAVLLLLGIVGSQMDKDKKSNTTSASTPVTTEQTSSSKTTSNSTGGMDLKTKIANNIKSIDGGDDLTKSPMTTATDFQIIAAIFKAYAMTVNEGRTSSDKEVLKLTAELQKKVIASQQKNFPRVRKAYYEFIKNKLWENDVYVDISGNGNTVIKFTGGFFAANKNIKETQEALSEMLILLRFKQTQYRWYRGQDEFTYYTIESSKDSELVE